MNMCASGFTWRNDDSDSIAIIIFAVESERAHRVYMHQFIKAKD
jgi:hypothetical protein